MLANNLLNRFLYLFLSDDDKLIYKTILKEGIDIISGKHDVKITLRNSKVIKCVEYVYPRTNGSSYYMNIYPYDTDDFESTESTQHTLSELLYGMVYRLGYPAYVKELERIADMSKKKVNTRVNKLVDEMVSG